MAAPSDALLLTRRATLFGLAGLAAAPIAGCAAPLETPVGRSTTPRSIARSPAAAASAPTATAAAQPNGNESASTDATRDETPEPGDARRLALPRRNPRAETGSAFFERNAELDRVPFEAAIFAAVSAGNVPDFERLLKPLDVIARTAAGKRHEARLFVLPDYLAIGSDDDYLRIPMTPMTAQRIATLTDCFLPTTKIVDAIYAHAAVKLPPSFIEGGPSYDNNHYDYIAHNRNLESCRARLRCRLGELTAGDKKDIVISNRLLRHPYRVAIYGWHRHDNDPIQPLSTVHSCKYADYSHGVRLVSAKMILDGEERRLEDLLRDPDLSELVSDEGPLEIVAYPTAEPPPDTGKHRRASRHASR